MRRQEVKKIELLQCLVNRKTTQNASDPALVIVSGETNYVTRIIKNTSHRKKNASCMAWIPSFAGSRKYAFTLIELSIVLVIIGLFAGGIMVGNDLIKSAEIRSQIQQIEQYQIAQKTFKLKYDYLPGDIPPSQVTGFGFANVPTRAGTQGQGDGDGVIKGFAFPPSQFRPTVTDMTGEPFWFWIDLTNNTSMIGGTFNNTTGGLPYPISETTSPKIENLLPRAKINGVYVDAFAIDADNYFSLLAFPAPASIDGWGAIANTSTLMTVNQTYSIDTKIDDGFPQSGKAIARYQRNNSWVWAAGGGTVAVGTSGTAATPASDTTCYDNGNVAGTQKYSVGTNGGNGVNCALSFKFQ
jgi:prepilin-type N-terminal cleavage/methylation domain-containing protein